MIEYPLLDDFDVNSVFFFFTKIFFFRGEGRGEEREREKKKKDRKAIDDQTFYLNSYENYNLPPIAYN